jgi:predicted metal-dependent phosphoesterase TrpH
MALAAQLGVAVVAITDHDTVDGLREGEIAASRESITLIPGIELNCDLEDCQADVLGYFVRPECPSLQGILSKIQDARVSRAREMVSRLQALGAPIEYHRVEDLAGSGVVTRPHVARVLVDVGFVPDVGAAFRKYIGHSGAAYVDRFRLSPREACQVIRRAGGVPTLAHPVPPAAPRSDPLHLRRFLPELVESGLGGLECHYPGYSAAVIRWLETLADHFGLVPTGGSDYHGSWRPHISLGCVDVPPEAVSRLEELAGDTCE